MNTCMEFYDKSPVVSLQSSLPSHEKDLIITADSKLFRVTQKAIKQLQVRIPLQTLIEKKKRFVSLYGTSSAINTLVAAAELCKKQLSGPVQQRNAIGSIKTIELWNAKPTSEPLDQ